MSNPVYKLLLSFIFATHAFSAVAANNEAPYKDHSQDYSVNTLYALLVAEMAGQRQLFDVALGNYLLEAHRTQDPGVAARATQIAQYIGAHQAALDASSLWVKLDQYNPIAQQSLSLELVKASRFSESTLHLQTALELDPALNMSFISIQGDAMSEGARESWLQALTPLLARHTKNTALLFNVASLHQLQKNNGKALELVDRLITQNQEYYPAWNLKARLHARQGDVETALSATLNALEHFKDDKAFTILKARLLIKQKDIAQARDVFFELTQRFPNDAHLLLPLALTQLELQENAQAKASLSHLLKLKQLQSEAHFYLGRIALHDKEIESALNHFLNMEHGREYLAAQSSIVNIYLQQQNIQKALDHIHQQRESDHTNQQAYFLMEVELLNRTGQLEKSLQVLNTALTAYADNTDLRYSRAMISEKLGDFVQLESDLSYIIDKNPKNATALNALGYTLADNTERLEEALKLIKQASIIAPKDPAIIDSLGWVYFRMGRLQESLKLLKQAYSRFPDAEVAAHLGEVLWTLGQQSEAREIWQESFIKQPKSQILKDTLERFKVSF